MENCINENIANYRKSIPWCSRELGNFYDMEVGAKEKFFMDLYDHGKIINLQLDGIELLKCVDNNLLNGRFG